MAQEGALGRLFSQLEKAHGLGIRMAVEQICADNDCDDRDIMRVVALADSLLSGNTPETDAVAVIRSYVKTGRKFRDRVDARSDRRRAWHEAKYQRPQSANGPDGSDTEDDRCRAIRNLLGMNPDLALLLNLHFVQGRSVEQSAADLGISRSGAYVLLNNAIRDLRAKVA
jgi:hypothetical protein